MLNKRISGLLLSSNIDASRQAPIFAERFFRAEVSETFAGCGPNATPSDHCVSLKRPNSEIRTLTEPVQPVW